jgi:ABC-type sugar transport system permease subunit
MRGATVRRLHLYLGAFVAPSVLFFALTGALQLFGLHEAHGDYHPPAVIEGLAKVHKDQVFAIKAPGRHAERAASKAHEADHEVARPKATTLALKVYFLFVAIALSVSTALGLWMALTLSRNRLLVCVLVLAGAAIPVLLLTL